MKIAFCDFWDRHQDDNNYFLHACRAMFDNVTVVKPEECDVLFFSCFGRQNLQYTHCKKVFYNSESYNNELFDADFCLSHDHDNSWNARLPHWMMVIDWFGVKTYTNPTWLTPPEWFQQENRKLDRNQLLNRKFMCHVYTNPVPNRALAASILSDRFEKVDVYGRPHQMKLEDTNLAKHNVVSQYKFSLAFENCIQSGYVTEKLFHARVANTIPVYWGAHDVSTDFDPDGFIHFNGGYDNELVPKIQYLLDDQDAYISMISKPIFTKTPTIEDALNPIRRALK